MRQVVQDARVNDIATTIARGREESPSWSDEEWQPWAGAKQHVSEQFLNALSSGSVIPQDWREQFARVRVPLLLITSDPDRGGIVTPEAAAEAQRILPDLKLVRLEGAGHNIRREQFDGFVEAVRAFLAAQHVGTPQATTSA